MFLCVWQSVKGHMDSVQEMKRLRRLIDDLNRQLFNLAGLNMLWPRKVGFLFVSRIGSFERFDMLIRLPKLEIEYYVSWQLLPWRLH